MMSTLQELIAQREALDKQIAETRKNELREAIRTVQSLVGEFDLTSADVFGSARTDKKADKRTGRKVAPKYRDPATGKAVGVQKGSRTMRIQRGPDGRAIGLQ